MKTKFVIIALLIILPFWTFCQNETDDWITNSQWGYKFQAPKNWKYQKDDSSVLLGHEKISGAILVIPTEAESFDGVKDQMSVGLEEEGTVLTLTGELKPLADYIIAGEYSGIYEYQEVKAYIIGSHSKYGSGAYILALDSPDMFSSELTKAAVSIAKGMKYYDKKESVAATDSQLKTQNGSTDLLRYFAGTYYSFTGGGVTSGGTERRFVICSNGQFYFSSESGYSGGAGTSGAWGVASQSGEAGTWSIKGSKTSGSIVLTYSNGNTDIVNYQVCGDGCIYFNNIKYAYEKAATCE